MIAGFRGNTGNLALTDVQKDEVAQARQELSKALDEMIEATKANQALQKKASEFNNKGQMAAVWGAVSGANDRDLAEMIKNFGGSLESTQKAVQVMLRLQNRKDHVLRDFHSLLIDKIQKIQVDTNTLDVGQKSAYYVLSEFRDQIEDQIRHHEAVDRHELEIDSLVAELENHENEFQQGLQALNDQLVSLKRFSEYLDVEVDSHGKNLDEFSKSITQEIKLFSINQKKT